MKRARKRTSKALHDDVKEEVKKEIKREALHEQIKKQFPGLYPHQIHDVKAMVDQYLDRGVDIGYLKTVLFPEHFSYDIPFPLSSISYCKFTNSQQVTINTGSGSGMCIWFPRVNGGYSLMVANTVNLPGPGSPQGIQFTDKMGSSGVQSYTYAWQLGCPQYSYQNFTSTALTAASIQIQYMGSVEQEQGYIVGGHIYGVSPDMLTTDDIENSQWVTRARPAEGARFLYLPKDESDFTFYPCQKTLSMNQGGNPTSIVQSIAGSKDSDNNIQLTLTGGGTSTSDLGYAIITGTDPTASTAKFTYAKTQVDSSGNTLSYVRNSNYIAFYWSGLQPSIQGFRVELTRKFCAIPTAATRDIVELVRPIKSFDSRRTFDVLNGLCNTAPIGGHTLKEIYQIIDPLIRYLPNASYVMQNGGLEQVNTLSELVETLQQVDGEEKNLSGPLKNNTQRLYRFNMF